jgi:hypothetical protein
MRGLADERMIRCDYCFRFSLNVIPGRFYHQTGEWKLQNTKKQPENFSSPAAFD